MLALVACPISGRLRPAIDPGGGVEGGEHRGQPAQCPRTMARTTHNSTPSLACADDMSDGGSVGRDMDIESPDVEEVPHFYSASALESRT